MFSKLSKKILRHKFITGICLLLFVLGVYLVYQGLAKDKNPIQYATAAVEKGALISSISGAGQVSASNQADIKSSVSGDVINLNIASGHAVTSGEIIALIDASETQKALRDARIALENAQLDLNKLLAPPEEIDFFKAESVLATAKRSLDELINPSEDALYDAENALITAQDSLTKLRNTQTRNYQDAVDVKKDAENDLIESYEDAFNTLTTVFFDLPTIITGLRDILYSEEIAESEISLYNYYSNISALINSISTTGDDRVKLEKFTNSAESNYKIAREKFDKNFENYRETSRYSDKDVIAALLEETLETVKAMAETAKSQTNMLDYWVDYRSRRDLEIFSKATEYQTDVKSYTSKTNGYLSSLLSSQRSLEDGKESIIDAKEKIKELEQDQPIDLAAAERTVKEKEDALYKLKNPEQYDIDDKEIAVKEKELALEELKAGADDVDVRSKELSIQQKYEALLAVQEKLAEHSVKAPFDGTAALVNISKGDTINSGAVIGTVITEQKIVVVTLNEIDIANIKIGQNATIGFDAIPDLTVTGKVIEVDTLGAITQGVVSYKIKIAFDVDDDRIKPGMTASASIIIDSKQNILLVPLSAVKAMGGSSYVEVLVNGQPERKTVVTGLSNDLMIEIVSGLEQGERVISQTISNGAAQNNSAVQIRAGGSMPGGQQADSMRQMQKMMR